MDAEQPQERSAAAAPQGDSPLNCAAGLTAATVELGLQNHIAAVDTALQRGDTYVAQELVSEELRYARRHFDASDPRVLESRLRVAEVAFKCRDFGAARQFYSGAAAQAEFGQQREIVLRSRLGLARCARAERDPEAVQQLEDLHTELLSALPEQKLLLVSVLTEKGRALDQLGQQHEAWKCFSAALLRALDDGQGADSAAGRNVMAAALQGPLERRDFASAALLLEDLTNRSDALPPQLIGALTYIVGISHLHQRAFKWAGELSRLGYQTFLRSEDQTGSAEYDLQLAAMENTLGVIALQQGNLDEAEDWFAAAVQRRELQPLDQNELALTRNVAELYSQRKEFVRAEGFGRLHLDQCRRLHASNSPAEFEALRFLCSIYDQSGRVVRQEECLQEAARVGEQLYGDSASVCRLRRTLSSIYMHRGRDDEARVLLKQLLDVYEQGDADPEEHAGVLINLAALAADDGGLEEMRRLGRAAVQILDQLEPAENTSRAAVRQEFATLLFSAGATAEAEAELSQAAAILDSEPEAATWLMSSVCRLRGSILQLSGESAAAVVELRHGAALAERAWGADHPLTGHALLDLASSCLSQDSLESGSESAAEARELAVRAQLILEDSGLDQDRIMLTALELELQALEQLGDWSAAEEVRSRLRERQDPLDDD